MQIYDTFFELGYYKKYDLGLIGRRDVFYPFFKSVLPRIAEVQEVPDCVVLIFFENERTNLFKDRKTGKIILDKELGAKKEKEIIVFGLEPLCQSNLLTKKEAQRIINWFQNVKREQNFYKHIVIDDAKYTIYTHLERKQRILVLAYDHIQP
ncbi:MAG: hypothetical protein PHR47_02500 [Candidatus Pacebacteria bacterium]|nr:hypothetical protein [Candidatus Paceibacterota bacterium]